MLSVVVAEDAKQVLANHLAESVFAQAGIYIYQELKAADVVRGEDGDVSWTIDRPNKWRLTICSFEKIPADEIFHVEGFPVHLVVVEPTSAIAVAIKAKNGQVFAEEYCS
jgi:hypothetical protein